MEIRKFSKGLSGDGKSIIPVCCVCGKVRSLDNQWHTVLIPADDVDISHTYCPPCASLAISALKPEIVVSPFMLPTE